MRTIPFNPLAGLSDKEPQGLFFRRVDKMKRILNDGLVATAARDNGAINIWKDDAGNIRCESMRYCMRLDEQIYTEMSDAETWAKKWLKEIK